MNYIMNIFFYWIYLYRGQRMWKVIRKFDLIRFSIRFIRFLGKCWFTIYVLWRQSMQKVVIRGRKWHGGWAEGRDCSRPSVPLPLPVTFTYLKRFPTSIQVSFEHVKRVCSATIIINYVKEHCEHSVRRNNYSRINDSR